MGSCVESAADSGIGAGVAADSGIESCVEAAVGSCVDSATDSGIDAGVAVAADSWSGSCCASGIDSGVDSGVGSAVANSGSSSRRIISPASARYASAPRESLSWNDDALPWLGASARRTLRGTMVRNTLSPKVRQSARPRPRWRGCCARRTSCAARLRSPASGLRLRLERSIVSISADRPSSA